MKERQTSWLDLHCCAVPALYVGVIRDYESTDKGISKYIFNDDSSWFR